MISNKSNSKNSRMTLINSQNQMRITKMQNIIIMMMNGEITKMLNKIRLIVHQNHLIRYIPQAKRKLRNLKIQKNNMSRRSKMMNSKSKNRFHKIKLKTNHNPKNKKKLKMIRKSQIRLRIKQLLITSQIKNKSNHQKLIKQLKKQLIQSQQQNKSNQKNLSKQQIKEMTMLNKK